MACGAQRTLEANGLGFRLYEWGAAGGRPALLLHSQAAQNHLLMRIEPEAMYAYAPNPERFPDGGVPASAPPGR